MLEVGELENYVVYLLILQMKKLGSRARTEPAGGLAAARTQLPWGNPALFPVTPQHPISGRWKYLSQANRASPTWAACPLTEAPAVIIGKAAISNSPLWLP